MSTVINVENLGKKYLLRHAGQGAASGSFREMLSEGAKRVGRRIIGAGGGSHAPCEEFWALRDVSFQIRQGDRIGIIGRNGAGKSTLLKILSRITDPSSGSVSIRGRVASLLEVGTGFHPELTGRENIFLNGAILGMGRQEIRKKFDEIVDFAEIERFLDTPVKRYSSGMYVRLAFAVAAHLEPEILLVDEVLAVGDAQFQKKCLGKMEEVSARGGRTVVFVSHNMATISSLCNRTILLEKGSVCADGDTSVVIERYLAGVNEQAAISLRDRTDRTGNGAIRFTEVTLVNERGDQVASFASGECAKLILSFQRGAPTVKELRVDLGIDNSAGERIFWMSNDTLGKVFREVGPSALAVEITLPRLQLSPGRYFFTIFASAGGEVVDWIQNAGAFFVEGGDYYRTGRLPPHSQGSFYANYDFDLKEQDQP
ncbi:ABC transporter ATP-binding protein [Geomonas sp. RF6]|uniref:ABC transporter ATP-binding protein n=1 Tax=Geomonas sp. RF6 TaxID=2897342 RepID=UPI001E5303B3|nr:ABC transporter ATP-binding protein [Geomonas sp. RF6]UFS69722.1 ABC transporter ATP-binding protein [Geomonas sp. RF6]